MLDVRAILDVKNRGVTKHSTNSQELVARLSKVAFSPHDASKLIENSGNIIEHYFLFTRFDAQISFKINFWKQSSLWPQGYSFLEKDSSNGGFSSGVWVRSSRYLHFLNGGLAVTIAYCIFLLLSF
ncbi:uncharacterized protein LOC112351472 [Selaginella moellendorffii]|uniref:uncharacterized protein LOC112351472 n=1 Tax=Selaginella moellendorffii TaxID=88036 RepID=UPI000D1CC72F|nr:uncharacterized protein LOC112351472 [Selaginella moellendorffii]|eukprot:XP_024545220.1 uncharacterized protein LOC112351472 [Selaginella moellendorffii]